MGLGLRTVISRLPRGSASGLFHWRTRPAPACFPRTLTHGRFGEQAGCLADHPMLEVLGHHFPRFPSPALLLQRLDEGQVDVLIRALPVWHRTLGLFKACGSLQGTLARPLCCARLVSPCCRAGPGSFPVSAQLHPRAQALDPSPQGPRRCSVLAPKPPLILPSRPAASGPLDLPQREAGPGLRAVGWGLLFCLPLHAAPWAVSAGRHAAE